MDMKSALRIMSENPEGHFAWKDQLVDLYSALTGETISVATSIEELVEKVDQLDPIIREAFYTVKIDFIRPPTKANFHIKIAVIIFGLFGYLLLSSQASPETVNEIVVLISRLLDFLSNNA